MRPCTWQRSCCGTAGDGRVPDHSGGCSFFAFCQRAWTALRAISVRSSGVRLTLRARAPRFPNATAAGFFRFHAIPRDFYHT